MAKPNSSSDTISSQSDLSEDRNQPLVRICVPSRENENDFKELRNGRLTNCLRCGHFMNRAKAIFLIVQSPFKDQPSKIRISMNEGAPCTNSNPCEEVYSAPKSENGSEGCGSEPSDLQNQSLDEVQETDAAKGDVFHLSQGISTTSLPCPDCHLTLLSDEDLKESSSDSLTIMLEIPPQGKQSDYKLEIPKAETREVVLSEKHHLRSPEPSISGSGRYENLPDMSPETEAAYRSHLKNLVPCSHCKRTFNPDRVMVHQNVCVERARKRQTKTH